MKKWEMGGQKEKRLQFHPMDLFPELFSDKMPDRMISYTWARFRLIGDIFRFIDESEIVAPPSASEEPTYWFCTECWNKYTEKGNLDKEKGVEIIFKAFQSLPRIWVRKYERPRGHHKNQGTILYCWSVGLQFIPNIERMTHFICRHNPL